jgi:hypothetical protein
MVIPPALFEITLYPLIPGDHHVERERLLCASRRRLNGVKERRRRCFWE